MIDFPFKYVQLYYTTFRSLGLDTNHLLTYDSFSSGRTLLAFNFRSEVIQVSLLQEGKGNLHIVLEFSTPVKKKNSSYYYSGIQTQ